MMEKPTLAHTSQGLRLQHLKEFDHGMEALLPTMLPPATLPLLSIGGLAHSAVVSLPPPHVSTPDPPACTIPSGCLSVLLLSTSPAPSPVPPPLPPVSTIVWVSSLSTPSLPARACTCILCSTALGGLEAPSYLHCLFLNGQGIWNVAMDTRTMRRVPPRDCAQYGLDHSVHTVSARTLSIPPC